MRCAATAQDRLSVGPDSAHPAPFRGTGRRPRTAQHTHDAADNKLTHDAAGVPPFMSGDCTLKASPVPAMASATAADVERRAPMLGTASTQSRQLPFPTVTRPGSKQQGTAHGAWAMAARAKRTHQAATTHAHALASRHQRAVLGGEPHRSGLGERKRFAPPFPLAQKLF